MQGRRHHAYCDRSRTQANPRGAPAKPACTNRHASCTRSRAAKAGSHYYCGTRAGSGTPNVRADA